MRDEEEEKAESALVTGSVEEQRKDPRERQYKEAANPTKQPPSNRGELQGNNNETF